MPKTFRKKFARARRKLKENLTRTRILIPNHPTDHPEVFDALENLSKREEETGETIPLEVTVQSGKFRFDEKDLRLTSARDLINYLQSIDLYWDMVKSPSSYCVVADQENCTEDHTISINPRRGAKVHIYYSIPRSNFHSFNLKKKRR
jgi:hypothetical protein